MQRFTSFIARGILVFFSGFILLTPHAYAASDECRFEDKLKHLATLQATTDRAGTEALKKELEARKDLLGLIIDCTKKDASAAEGILRETEGGDWGLQEVEGRLFERLSESHRYLDTEKKRLDDFGLRGTRDAARALKQWRTLYFFPMRDHVSNVVLFTKSANLLKTADARIRQITQTLRTLNLLEREEIRTSFEEAERELKNAKEKTEEARQALLKMQDPAATSLLIRDSLHALSKTYERFFALSTEVKKALPL